MLTDATLRTWITLSSSVILFNKWILDTAKFRKSKSSALCLFTVLTSILQISVCPPLLHFPTNQTNFGYFRTAITLTCWHLVFATLMTQIMARSTHFLDGRKSVKMTGRVYLRAIVPIGAFFSLSLMCGNMTYLYLSVAFIQMLKVGVTQGQAKLHMF